MQSTTTISRKRGALLGLAVGDALGAAVEFQAPDSFEPVTGFRGDGPHELGPGEWTDDTSMALALADSIANANTDSGWDLNDQMRRYVAWYRTGAYSVNGRCFDIGFTTRAALARFEKLADARTSGDTASDASGNGSIMRLAPVAIYFADLYPDRIDDLARYAAESSMTTHASPQCISACRYMGVVLAAMVCGVARDEALSPDWPALERIREIEPLHPEIDDVVVGSYRLRKPPEIRGRGYVVGSLEAALWAFHDAADFREAVLKAVNLGDDADTTGAVCGQFAGAFFGENGIPTNWLNDLAKRPMIEKAITGLLL